MADKVDVLAVMEASTHVLFDGTEQGRIEGVAMKGAMAAVAELIAACTEMHRLAKGPVGGVSQSDKRAIVARVSAALSGASP